MRTGPGKEHHETGHLRHGDKIDKVGKGDVPQATHSVMNVCYQVARVTGTCGIPYCLRKNSITQVQHRTSGCIKFSVDTGMTVVCSYACKMAEPASLLPHASLYA